MKEAKSRRTTIGKNTIPYGRQWIVNDDVRAVVKVLHSDRLTTGRMVQAFEQALARYVGAREGVAVSSGTAALHSAMYAFGIRPGDEVIVPAMTFVATANAVVFQGGTPVFADVEPETLLISPDSVEKAITSRTKAIAAVDYAGQPCDYDSLQEIADRHRLKIVADASHSLGAEYRGRKVGTLADATVFSFHPVKHITTGEGGMVVTDNSDIAGKISMFRNHGIDANYEQRAKSQTWYYEMIDLGYNYRITDIQCALGLSQLGKLPRWIARRRAIARQYDKAFNELTALRPLSVARNVKHVYHLYVVSLNFDVLRCDRTRVFKELRSRGIGVNVHYIPVHLHPFYRQRFGTKPGLCPIAEAAYERILSLPIYPAMKEEEPQRVVSSVNATIDLLK